MSLRLVHIVVFDFFSKGISMNTQKTRSFGLVITELN